jgi:hypothetical protein
VAGGEVGAARNGGAANVLADRAAVVVGAAVCELAEQPVMAPAARSATPIQDRAKRGAAVTAPFEGIED